MFALTQSSRVLARKANAVRPLRRSVYLESSVSTTNVRDDGTAGLLGPPNLNHVQLDMFFERAWQPLPSSYLRRNAMVAASLPKPVPKALPTPDKPANTTASEASMLIEDAGPKTHHFDTFDQVVHLQNAGKFSRRQANAITQTLQHRLRTSLKSSLLPASQLENESYLITAAIAEFRREVQLMRRNDSVLLESELNALAREVESLGQRLNEDLGNMRADIQLSINDYQADIRAEKKLTELEIQSLNNRLTVLLGDAATNIESLKWGIIWRGLLGGVTAALSIAAIGYALSFRNAKKPETPKDTSVSHAYVDQLIA